MRDFSGLPRIGAESYHDTESQKERLERKERERREGIAKYHVAIDAIRKAREREDVDFHTARESG